MLPLGPNPIPTLSINHKILKLPTTRESRTEKMIWIHQHLENPLFLNLSPTSFTCQHNTTSSSSINNVTFHHPYQYGSQASTIIASMDGQNLLPMPSIDTFLYQKQQLKDMPSNHHKTCCSQQFQLTRKNIAIEHHFWGSQTGHNQNYLQLESHWRY